MRWLNKVIFILLLSGSLGAEAVEMLNSNWVDISKDFVTVFERQGHLGYESIGGIFKEGFNWQEKKDAIIVKSFLVWSVQGKRKKMDTEIKITKPSGQIVSVKHNWVFKTHVGVQSAMSMVADVTKALDQNGQYKIGQQNKSKNKFGGWALISILKSKKFPLRKIHCKVGMSALKPGEIYLLGLLKKGTNGQVSKVTTFGGGGVSGNGSTNALNGATVSGKDDWNGSQGNMWDVDAQDVKRFKILTHSGVSWSIDPLLQWLYPAGACVQVDLNNN